MLKPVEGMPDDVVAVEGIGTITGENYQDEFIPLLENKLRAHDKLKLLYVLGPAFSGFTVEAIWDDAKVGLQHHGAITKVAIVSYTSWVVNAVRFFSVILPYPVKVFEYGKLAEAKAWVAE